MRGDAHLAAAGAGAAAAFSETRDLIGAGGLQRWSEAEHYSGEDRNQECEDEDAGAEVTSFRRGIFAGAKLQQSSISTRPR